LIYDVVVFTVFEIFDRVLGGIISTRAEIRSRKDSDSGASSNEEVVETDDSESEEAEASELE